MKQSLVLKKLDRLVEKRRAKLLEAARSTARQKKSEYFDPKFRAQQLRDDAAKLNRRTISGLVYLVKSNYFSNSRGTCGFNPDTYEGHSYRWYSLVKRIKGIVILNTYNYSSCTAKHIGHVGAVLRDLGIKYQCLEAPRGLQKLEEALKYEIGLQAAVLVRQKYQRKSNRWIKYQYRESEKRLKLLAKLGFKPTKAMKAEALKAAEESRQLKNERARAKALERKKMKALLIVSDFTNEMHDLPGYHLVKPWDSVWTEGSYTGRVQEYELREAVRQGATRVLVHSAEAPKLKLVQGGAR